MSELVEALDRLVSEHRRIGSPMPDFLVPGIHPDDVRARLGDLGLKPPEEVVELFAWHNGSDDSAFLDSGAGLGYPRPFDDVFFGTLDEAIAFYGDCLKIDRNVVATYGDPAAAIWRLSWFPPFSGGLPSYGIECDPTVPSAGMVFEPQWHPPIEGSEHPRFRNLTHLVQSVVRRFEAGGYSWDRREGWLDENDKVLDRLRRLELEETLATG
jgi:hypothetical protein